MKWSGRRASNWSRRAALAAALGMPALAQQSARAKVEPLPADWTRYSDPSTEFDVIRLTRPDYDSLLPALPARAITRRSDALLYASNKSGGLFQLFRVDLKNGQSRPVAGAAKLDPRTFTLTPDDRSAAYWEDGRLMGGDNEVYRLPEGVRPAGPLCFSEDGLHLYWVERKGERSAVRRMRWPKAAAETILEAEAEWTEVQPNPRRATLFTLDAQGQLWLAAFDGTQRRRLEAPPGRIEQALWSPDGRTVLYLHIPSTAGQLHAIREYDIDTRADRLVSSTSQFSRFARNANGSIYVGASQSKASPVVVLLLRITRRELTLAEHKASKPQLVSPQFTPNSQRVVFESDREGRNVLYMMNVEKLVEKTEG